MTPASETGEADEAMREERRRVRRRRRARLKAAELGRSRGGLTSKVHLAADRRCRPLSFVLTSGQAADSPRFTAVIERIKVRGPVGVWHRSWGAVAERDGRVRVRRRAPVQAIALTRLIGQ
jgi:hypothetical protein